MQFEDEISWARVEAERLRGLSPIRQGGGDYEDVAGSWAASVVTGAMEFLRTRGAANSFHKAAVTLLQNRVERDFPAEIARILDAWADHAEAGLTATRGGFEASARVAASTDLMEQVDLLLQDKRVHPAAPVMLAGAALEELLRAMVVDCGEAVVGKPSIASYADALRRAGLLDAQDVKDVTAFAGLRNHAAHGEFDKVQGRAQYMVDGVNLFMQRQRLTPKPVLPANPAR
jgi:hypothetical protein